MTGIGTHSISVSACLLAGLLGTATVAAAQDISDLQIANSPLVLKAQGSFLVGGVTVSQTATEIGGFSSYPGGQLAVNQMYVQYMIPQGNNKVPVVMIHGGTLSGKSYETTPDGRMGWDEYFVRNAHAVYKPDQVGRGRSGFNQAVYNNVRLGVVPPLSQPVLNRIPNDAVWTTFRFGPTPNVPYV